MTTQYLHYRQLYQDGTYYPLGGLTIAYEVGIDELPRVHYGFAICSPEDNFERQVGRIIANERLLQETMTFLGTEEEFRATMDFQQARFHARKRRGSNYE